MLVRKHIISDNPNSSRSDFFSSSSFERFLVVLLIRSMMSFMGHNGSAITYYGTHCILGKG